MSDFKEFPLRRVADARWVPVVQVFGGVALFLLAAVFGALGFVFFGAGLIGSAGFCFVCAAACCAVGWLAFRDGAESEK